MINNDGKQTLTSQRRQRNVAGNTYFEPCYLNNMAAVARRTMLVLFAKVRWMEGAEAEAMMGDVDMCHEDAETDGLGPPAVTVSAQGYV